MRALASAVLLATLVVAGSAAAACREMVHEEVRYAVCEAGPGDDLRLFLTAPDGQPYATFGRIDDALAAEGLRLVFAMNGGMYHADRRPVGLYVEDGVQRAPLVTAAGPGNFGLLPNGVFCVTEGGYAVVESRAFAARPPACRHATQSGPMLVIGGALHPRFLPDSPSRLIRNGIGVTGDGRRAVLAIARDRVNFDGFARFFRDVLGTPDALYLDGNVSRLYAPGLGRADAGFPMGPVVGMVARR
jgi:uncharacterized protein YigE (DUF2233 family)